MISNGVAKRLTLICSNRKSKKNYSAYLAMPNHNPNQTIRAFEKVN